MERLESMESPGTYVTERVSRGHFCLALCSFGPLSRRPGTVNFFMLSVQTKDSWVRDSLISHQPTQFMQQKGIKALIEHEINTLLYSTR